MYWGRHCNSVTNKDELQNSIIEFWDVCAMVSDLNKVLKPFKQFLLRLAAAEQTKHAFIKTLL